MEYDDVCKVQGNVHTPNGGKANRKVAHPRHQCKSMSDADRQQLLSKSAQEDAEAREGGRGSVANNERGERSNEEQQGGSKIVADRKAARESKNDANRKVARESKNVNGRKTI